MAADDFYDPVGDDDGYDDGGYLDSLFGPAAAALRAAATREDGPRAAATRDAEPSLGEDSFDTLRRARCYDELKRQHQVDLDDAKHLAGLEDPGLQAHMVQARKRLADSERARSAIVSAESLRRDDAGVSRMLSELTTSLKDQQMALQVAWDDVVLQATNAQRIASGDQPHGYPAMGSSASHFRCFEHFGEKVAAAGRDLARIVGAFEEFERKLTLARRGHESVVSGLLRRSQYFEDVALLAAAQNETTRA
jgi:hypothetical protein